MSYLNRVVNIRSRGLVGTVADEIGGHELGHGEAQAGHDAGGQHFHGALEAAHGHGSGTKEKADPEDRLVIWSPQAGLNC